MLHDADPRREDHMAFMEWDDRFSVNITTIDDQHKKLIGMVNTFYDSIQDGKKAAFGSLLKDLVNYTIYHFSTEEKYMERFNYPEIESHKQEHRLFTDKVLDVKKRFEDGRFVVTLEITNYLKDWIAQHVLGTDKRYASCFISNGLK
jgi:hemerythrin